MLEDMIDADWIADVAGSGPLGRGYRYWRAGHVRQFEQSEHEWKGTVAGSRDYSAWVREDRRGIRWDCTCPAADDGSFCKHLVAISLEALIHDEDPVVQKNRAAANRFREALLAQPVETLVDWLMEFASDDLGIRENLQVRLSLFSPEELKANLRAKLRTGGFLDYRRSMDYAAGLEGSLEVLSRVQASDPELCVELCELAIKRLLKVLESADDSSGAIGEVLHRFAYLHGLAVTATGKGGKSLASRLYKMKLADDWGLFPLDNYWDVLGEKGQAHYASLIEKEFAALPAPGKMRIARADADFNQYDVLRRREELAWQLHDYEGLVALYSRDLPAPHAYQKLVDASHDFGRDVEATNWAERAVRDNPDHSGVHAMLAFEYDRVGLSDEAMQCIWRAFQLSPKSDYWDQLKSTAGKDWPSWREKALDCVANREHTSKHGQRDVTERVRFLIQDQALAEAVALAGEHGVYGSTLDDLAELASKAFPAQAAAFWRRCVDMKLERAVARDYPTLVRTMKKASKIDPGQDTEQWLLAIRSKYARRPALMECMNKAGL